MDVHDSWTSRGFSLEPVAPRTGPFPTRPFLETWWERRDPARHLRLAFVEDEQAMWTFVDDGTTLRFCGPPHLTDYHTPLGEGTAGLLARAVQDALPGRHLVLDSLPEAAATAAVEGLESAGIPATIASDELTAVLALPSTFEAWQASLPKKDRHELRRKLRRFATERGVPELVRGVDEASLADFVALHRRAAGAKGAFMTARMHAFFQDLIDRAGAVVDRLIANGRTYAAAFAFEEEAGYYVYNAAYDPEAASASPGIVLMAAVVADQIDRRAEFVDFLKGAEDYKFRLGAEARPLATVAGEIP